MRYEPKTLPLATPAASSDAATFVLELPL